METKNVSDQSNISISTGLQNVMDRYGTDQKAILYKGNIILEERSVSTAIQYKNCAQILVLSVNKSPIRYAFRNATESYTV